MKPHLILFLLLPLGLLAQSPGSDSTRHNRRLEVGLNITNTLTSVFGSTSNNLTTDPYLISLRYGEMDRRRWRMGLNFGIRDKSDSDLNGFITDTKEVSADIRIGYEWVKPMSRQLAFFWGIDGVFTLQNEEVLTSGFFGTSFLKTQNRGFGGGPVLGIQWRVHPRVALTTECSIYAVYQSGFEEIDAPPDVRRDPISEFQWRPLLPSSLFVHFAF